MPISKNGFAGVRLANIADFKKKNVGFCIRKTNYKKLLARGKIGDEVGIWCRQGLADSGCYYVKACYKSTYAEKWNYIVFLIAGKLAKKINQIRAFGEMDLKKMRKKTILFSFLRFFTINDKK